MTQTHRPPAAGAHAAAGKVTVTKWVGWVLFAGILMVSVGIFNVIDGVTALVRPDHYAVDRTGLVAHLDYPAWGWVLLAFGVLVGLAGYGVLGGRTWARVVGVAAAAVNAVANLAFISAYPVWIVLTVALDVIIIYALTVHGREASVFRQ